MTENATTTSSCYDAADRLTSTTDARYPSVAYDAHGNTTTLGPQTLAYDGADRHVGTTVGTTAVRYVRDANDRIVERKVNGTTVARYSYSADGDTPDAVLDAANTVVERSIALVGGAMVTKRAGGDVWSYPNVHGDVMATAHPAGQKVGPTLTYDPYGQALAGLPDNSAGNLDYGWLGQHQRPLEHEGAVATIEMGARQYVPGLGRFLEVDPVEGGSDNDYDYVGGDPINSFDLDGMAKKCRTWDVRCKAAKVGRVAWKYRYEIALTVATIAVPASGALWATRSAMLARAWNTSRVARGISLGAKGRFMLHAPHRVGARGHFGR